MLSVSFGGERAVGYRPFHRSAYAPLLAHVVVALGLLQLLDVSGREPGSIDRRSSASSRLARFLQFASSDAHLPKVRLRNRIVPNHVGRCYAGRERGDEQQKARLMYAAESG